MTDAARTLTAVVVDDEAPARSLLKEYLAAHDDVRVVGECANGFEAVKRIAELRPGVVFLDIQMPKLDGFEVLELLEHRPAVIFVTAYDEYALKAFEVHAVDYVLKPVGRDRLAQALARVRERLQAPADAHAGPPVAALAATARAPGRFLERVVVKDGDQVHVVPVGHLDWIRAQDDYVEIRSRGKSYLKPQTLSDLAAGLDPARFVRIHRSIVLNIERLARIELHAKDSRTAFLQDGQELPVSRAGYARLKELMG